MEPINRASVKLQLDTYTLQALLGANPDMQVALTQAVVEEFTKRTLKSIENTPAYRGAIAAVNRAVQDQIGKLESGWSSKFVPTANFKKLVDEHVARHVETYVQQVANQTADSIVQRVMEHLPGMVETRVNAQVAGEIQLRVKNRLAELMGKA